MQHWNMVLRAGCEFPSIEVFNNRLDKNLPAMTGWGWGVGWSPSQAPRCAAGEAQLLLAAQLHLTDVLQSREMDTHTRFLLPIQDLFKISLPSNGKTTMQIFMKYINGLSLPCMDPCKLLPSWIWKMCFYIGISELASNSSSTIDEIMTKMDGIITCRCMAMYKLQDLETLPSSSVQLNVSFTAWLNANQMVKAVSSPYACCSLHGEGIQAYKPGRNWVTILVIG